MSPQTNKYPTHHDIPTQNVKEKKNLIKLLPENLFMFIGLEYEKKIPLKSSVTACKNKLLLGAIV